MRLKTSLADPGERRIVICPVTHCKRRLSNQGGAEIDKAAFPPKEPRSKLIPGWVFYPGKSMIGASYL